MPWEDLRLLARERDGHTDVLGWPMAAFRDGNDPLEAELGLGESPDLPEAAAEILALLAEAVERDLPVVIRVASEDLTETSALQRSIVWARALLPAARRRDAALSFASAHPVSDLLERGAHLVVIRSEAELPDSRWRESTWTPDDRIEGPPPSFRLLQASRVLLDCARRRPEGRRAFASRVGISDWAAASPSVLEQLWDLEPDPRLDRAFLEKLLERTGSSLEGPRWEGILGDPARAESTADFRTTAETALRHRAEEEGAPWRAELEAWLAAHLDAHRDEIPFDDEIVFRLLDGGSSELKALATISESDQVGLVELIDQSLRTTTTPDALVATLIRAGIWGVWRRWTSLDASERGARALDWMGSTAWRDRWPTYEDWRRVVADLVEDTGPSRARFLAAPEWPRIPLCGTRQARDVEALAERDPGWWGAREEAERLWTSLEAGRTDDPSWVAVWSGPTTDAEAFQLLFELLEKEARSRPRSADEREVLWDSFLGIWERVPESDATQADRGTLAPLLRLAAAIRPDLGAGQVARTLEARQSSTVPRSALERALREALDSEWEQDHAAALLAAGTRVSGEVRERLGPRPRFEEPSPESPRRSP